MDTSNLSLMAPSGLTPRQQSSLIDDMLQAYAEVEKKLVRKRVVNYRLDAMKAAFESIAAAGYRIVKF